MVKPYKRTDRLSILLHQDLQKEIWNLQSKYEIEITRVRINSNFKHARVYISTRNEAECENACNYLNANSHLLSINIQKNWTARFFPKLNFLVDKLRKYQNQVSNIMDSEEFQNTLK